MLDTGLLNFMTKKETILMDHNLMLTYHSVREKRWFVWKNVKLEKAKDQMVNVVWSASLCFFIPSEVYGKHLTIETSSICEAGQLVRVQDAGIGARPPKTLSKAEAGRKEALRCQNDSRTGTDIGLAFCDQLGRADSMAPLLLWENIGAGSFVETSMQTPNFHIYDMEGYEDGEFVRAPIYAPELWSGNLRDLGAAAMFFVMTNPVTKKPILQLFSGP